MNAQLFTEKKSTSRRKVISYAYLAQASRDENDLLGGITSIFKPIAKEFSGEIFEAETFCNLVDELYGLKINPWAAQDLIGRLESHGLLIEHKIVDGVKQYIYAEIEEEFSQITQSDIESVIEDFVIFSEPKMKVFGVSMDKELLGVSFLDHMTDLNFISTTLRPDNYTNNSNKKSTLSLDAEKAKWREDVQKDFRLNSLCAGFVLDAFNKDKELYELIVKIVSGALVSEVVLNFQEPAKDVSLERVNIILDTPFLMAFLNLTCEKEHVFSIELCDQIVDKKANLAVFEHSIDELKDNLKAVLHNDSIGKAFGATGRRLRGKPFNSYLKQILKDPESALKRLGVRTLRNLTSVSSYKFFSEEQEQSLCNSLGYYNNHKAQERDALSIALTMRHRNGNRIDLKEYYNCHYIFLTENSFIPDKSMEFMVRSGVLLENNFPPAVSGRYLSGLLWVLFGGKGQDLSKQLLLANCAAALEPKNDLVMKMHQFLEDTDPVQAELFEALMGDERAGQYLMQSSLGDAALLTKDNAVELLQGLQVSLTEKVEAEAKEKIRSIENEKIKAVKEIESKRNKELEVTLSEHQRELSLERMKQEELTKKLLDADTDEFKRNIEIQSLNEKLDEYGAVTKAKYEDEGQRFKRKIDKAMKVSLMVEKHFKYTLAFCVLLVGMSMNISALYVDDLIEKVAICISASIISMLGFWFVPDKVFGRLLVWRRDHYFKKLLDTKDLEIDTKYYEVDWVSEELKVK
jgi:hypothetical protein